MIESVEFGGWPNCLRVANERIEIVATTDVGPRIIRCGFVGGQNLFKVFEAEAGLTGGDAWRSYGGHRFWHAPEVFPRTYAPDNVPIGHTWHGHALTLTAAEPANGLEKQVRVSLHAVDPCIRIEHRLTNRGRWTVELAPWALSVMAAGGRAVYPQEDYLPHPEVLVPARPLVLWHFADMSDPRWTWGRRYVQLRQDPSATTKQKIGLLNTKGWAAYLLNGDVFIKRYRFDPDATYPDFGCNTETYTDSEMLEVETLGPLTRLDPGASVDHVETWMLARTDCGVDEDDIDAKLLPLVEQVAIP
ncbi:MAG TPA: hypothetical protein VIV06_05720 [Candidatus Limnocylindrales bacterium]